MSVFNKRTVMVDGIRVEVLEAGSGEPLVYLHGAGSTSGFQDLLPLSQSRRLIVPIHPRLRRLGRRRRNQFDAGLCRPL